MIQKLIVKKPSLLNTCVFVSGFGPSVSHEKLSVAQQRVQSKKNKRESCSLFDAIGVRSSSSSVNGLKTSVWKNLDVYAN